MVVRYINIDFDVDFNRSSNIDNCMKKAILRKSFYYKDLEEFSNHKEKMSLDGYDHIMSYEGQRHNITRDWIQYPYANYTKKVDYNEALNVLNLLKNVDLC